MSQLMLQNEGNLALKSLGNSILSIESNHNSIVCFCGYEPRVKWEKYEFYRDSNYANFKNKPKIIHSFYFLNQSIKVLKSKGINKIRCKSRQKET